LKRLIPFLLIACATSAALGYDLDYVTAIKSGGDTSVDFPGESVTAFRQPAANLTEAETRLHLKGDGFFERNFSDDPTADLHGLGPVYNNTSCISCHTRDGRGALPVVLPGQDWVMLKQNESIFLRISLETPPPVKDAAHGWGAPLAVPDFSTQLFHLAGITVRPDLPGVGLARVSMKYEKSSFVYSDQTVVNLRKPVFKITDPYTDRILQADVRTSPRMGTPMIGLGLLEAIEEQDILALAARDLTSEGVSGRPNYVFDIAKAMRGETLPITLGRFGLKANTPSVFHQSLAALNGDLGVTNYAFPQESIAGTALARNFPPALGEPEASREVSDALVFYSETLAVPSRRNVENPTVVRGAQLFHDVRCTSCHQPSFTTSAHSSIRAFASQKIYPYTDLLLHDMGPGLADGRRDFDADGQEGKTRPLWGLGHTQTINPRAGYLHDGRARTLEEAILWHDGEARYSRDRFTKLLKSDREALILFLKSL
jgi:CxxC motif-containing protein (DUF1111 family)